MYSENERIFDLVCKFIYSYARQANNRQKTTEMVPVISSLAQRVTRFARLKIDRGMGTVVPLWARISPITSLKKENRNAVSATGDAASGFYVLLLHTLGSFPFFT